MAFSILPSPRNSTVRDTGRDESFERQRRTSNMAYRVISLVSAFLIWLYVAGNEAVDLEKSFSNITISLENTDVMERNYGLSIISDPTYTVDVVVSGKKSDMNKLRADDIKAYVDFSTVNSPGEVALPVQVRLKQISSLKITPQTTSVMVRVDVKQQRNLDIDIQSRYSVAKGYSPEFSVSPSSITISGPGESLDKVAMARLNLNLGPLDSPKTVRENIVLVDAEGNVIRDPYIKANYTTVTVNVSLSMQKAVPLTVKYKYGYFTPQTVNTTITPASVLLKGPPEVLESMNEIVLEIDETKIERDTDLNVAIPIPDSATNLDGVSTALVSIQLKDNDTKSLTLNTFKVKAPPAGLDYTIDEKQLVVRFRGPTKDLSRLSIMDVSASIDLSKHGEKGTYSQVPVIITVNTYNTVYAVGDYSVTVKIE